MLHMDKYSVDSGWAAEFHKNPWQIFKPRRTRIYSFPSGGSIIKSVIDTSSSDDSSWQIAVAAAIADAANGIDAAPAAAAACNATDYGAGADSSPGVSVGLSVSENGAGGESLVIAVALAISDTGNALDVVQLASEILKSVTDLASSSDLIGAVSVACATSDTATAAEAMAAGIAVQLSDAAGAADTIYIAAEVVALDTGTGIDALAVLQAALKAIADSSTGIDDPVIAVTLNIAEIGYGTDAHAIGALLAVLDAAGAIDASIHYDIASRIVAIRFALARRAVVHQFRAREIHFSLLRV
jgi:hypothetical protein